VLNICSTKMINFFPFSSMSSSISSGLKLKPKTNVRAYIL
jgi:hypothetical protein